MIAVTHMQSDGYLLFILKRILHSQTKQNETYLSVEKETRAYEVGPLKPEHQ